MEDLSYQEELIRDMNWCLRKHPDATPAEKRELLVWVKNGFSPGDNPYSLYYDDGFPMDFIDGTRIGNEMCDDCTTDPEGFRIKWGFPTGSLSLKEEETDSLDELPF